VQDAKAVCAKARSVGALVLLDTYQSLGTLPVDVRELGVDMVTGGSVKWLCGGPGACYLYVRPELQDKLEPLITGWAGHAAPFAFELGAQRYAKGIRRFLNGSPAVPSLLQASAGYEIVLEVGVDAIRRHSVTLTETLRLALADKGFESGSPVDPAQRGGSLTVRLRADEHGPSYVAALEQRGILVDHRPEAGLRVSPHFYTTWSELDAFVAALVELRESGKWKQATAAKGY
jgi:kynureninase